MQRPCEAIHDDLAGLVAGDPELVARHADHLASCDDCRDARHEASQLARVVGAAGDDHVAPDDLVARLMAAVDKTPEKPAPVEKPVTPITRQKPKQKPWLAIGAGAAALAAGSVGVYLFATRDGNDAKVNSLVAASGPAGKVTDLQRAAKDQTGGLTVADGNGGWIPLAKGATVPQGATIKTDDRTRVAVALSDGTRVVLDHDTTLAFAHAEPRKLSLTSGRVVADVAQVANRPASISTKSGTIDIVGTKLAVVATDTHTTVQVIRGAVMVADHEVRAGEEALVEGGKVAVAAAPGLGREVEWSELAPPVAQDAEQTTAGLGALRAYKPGEKRDRDWNLALAKHDVKVRIAGPVARTEITETFRNDSDSTLEGVYQFPLPADAQIDNLQLDVADAPGGFEQGAFVDKDRAGKIWKGVIDKATPKVAARRPEQDIIWVQGPWRDPALLDWKRGGRFELRIFPIPAKGTRTIKISYTQVVTPRGPWRQYVYPLPHSTDGSTVADSFSVDVEVRGAAPNMTRAANYQMTADANRKDVSAMTLSQGGFVPRGDLVIDYRAADGDAELRAWTYTGGAAVAPDEKLAAKKNVGIDPLVVAAQRAEAADARPTAVIALRPKLPRWREAKARDYTIVVDSSQSMVGERAQRARKLASALVEQMDRRDRFTVMACDTECKKQGDLRTPSMAAATETAAWLAKHDAAGASDVVGSVRSAILDLKASVGTDRERWVLYVGDGFATTGFRRVADVEKAITHAAADASIHVGAIGIGGDADQAVLAAVARGGGGSYIAWTPGMSEKAAAIAGLESSYGTSLRGATLELPAGLTDAAPTTLPTVRAGEEILVAARIGGEVAGDVVLKGSVGGQPFEQRYPLKLAVSSSAGNGFVPRLWASLAIEQLERAGRGEDRAKIVALSQGYGVMSRETSLLVLESAAMFEAFGVDRRTPANAWTGEEDVEEVVADGTVSYKDSPADAQAAPKPAAAPAKEAADKKSEMFDDGFAGGGRAMPRASRRPNMIAMRRIFVRVPSLSGYEGVNARITKAITDAEAALAASPDSREKHRALVQALSYGGEIQRAREVANRWLERDRLDPQALGYLADLLGREGQRDLALRTLSGLVDLDADRAALHERMIGAYDRAGRAVQACSHRIALSSIQAKDAKVAGAAVRCLRALGRDRDAELVVRGLADDTLRAAAEKAATVAPLPANNARDVIVDARWQGNEDLDISLVAPDGTRVSWMGGRTDLVVEDVTGNAHERLGLRGIKRGNYLVEISRASGSGSTVRGTLDLAVLGAKRSLPFELTGGRATVARITIGLEERLVPVDPMWRGRVDSRGRIIR